MKTWAWWFMTAWTFACLGIGYAEAAKQPAICVVGLYQK